MALFKNKVRRDQVPNAVKFFYEISGPGDKKLRTLFSEIRDDRAQKPDDPSLVRSHYVPESHSRILGFETCRQSDQELAHRGSRG
ncbi:hypothetical protein JG687_00015701 [Phytophthora cactorum]|uniref:Uncharacterized protein n=1 Tax=Phytophthora cactorum TaxID=29920 RepID=A0A8T1TU85_9STRA|nr:hypothetical protein JG687_00015701 [Phytophthora cactorum]